MVAIHEVQRGAIVLREANTMLDRHDIIHTLAETPAATGGQASTAATGGQASTAATGGEDSSA